MAAARFRRVGIVLALVAGWPRATFQAQVVSQQYVAEEMVPEVDSISAADKRFMGIGLQADSGWYTYRKNSGDAGSPTSIRWMLPVLPTLLTPATVLKVLTEVLASRANACGMSNNPNSQNGGSRCIPSPLWRL